MITNTLLILLVLTALWTVITRSSLKSAIGLALISAIVTILIFRLDSPLAAVFELSVCTGLITAIFASVIGLTRQTTRAEKAAETQENLRRFWFLPLIMLVVGIVLVKIKAPIDFVIPSQVNMIDPRVIMWGVRRLDLFGQIIIMLAGAFGVLILFKERKDDR